MGEQSARLALPLLVAGQAQKEMTHNEALLQLELLVQAAVADVPANDPPPSPAIGGCWIVADAPTGDWAGMAGALAMWSDGGWRFAMPREGHRVWVASRHADAWFADGAWHVGERQNPIVAPTGGAVADAEARLAITAMIEALRSHGLIDG